MTNPYNAGQPYINNYQNNPYMNGNFNSRPSIFANAVGSAALGFTAGSGVSLVSDFVRNRKPVKNGEVSDSFAKQVLDKIVDKGYSFKNKEFFNQKTALLNKLKKIKSPEEFSKLMKKYKTYASTLFDGMSLDSVCKTVNKENLKGKVSAIKKRIEATLEPEIRNIKDTVKLCWDSENKKFVKPKNVEEKIFKVIKNTKNNIQWKKMLKYGGITAGVFGAVTLVYSMLMNKNNLNYEEMDSYNNVQNYV